MGASRNFLILLVGFVLSCSPKQIPEEVSKKNSESQHGGSQVVNDLPADVTDEVPEDSTSSQCEAHPNLPPQPSAPQISREPIGKSVLEGASFELSLQVDFQYWPVQFQWKKDGVDLPGENLNVLVRSAALLSDSGVYSVLVKNKAGEVLSSTALVHVTTPPPPIVDVEPDFGKIDSRRTLAMGLAHSCAIKNGGLYCWGLNSDACTSSYGCGQVGQGSSIGFVRTPTAVSSLSSAVTEVGAGWWHTCALASGSAYCFGWNGGPLGQKSPNGQPVHAPQKIASLGSDNIRLASGQYHNCVIKSSGQLLCWGRNDYGETGTNSPTGQGAIVAEPTPVPGLEIGVTDVALSHRGGCAVKNQSLFCWGANAEGELGIGEVGSPRNSPVQVLGLDYGVIKVVSGFWFSCALQDVPFSTGKQRVAKCWGWTRYGALGLGQNKTGDASISAPIQLPLSATEEVENIFAFGQTACAKVKGLGVRCWGYNSIYGSAGIGTFNESVGLPTEVTEFNQGEVLEVSSGLSYHGCALHRVSDVSKLKCWGRNDYYQLGLGDILTSNAPQFVMDWE